MNAGEAASSSAGFPDSAAASTEHTKGQPKLHDFRRPDKFSKDQLRTMQNISEAYARLASADLSAGLRLPCELKLETVDQMTYGEFMDPLSCPCSLAVIGVKPLKGNVIIHIDAAGSDGILERLFGTLPAHTDSPLASGGLTALEAVSLEATLPALLKPFGESWAMVENLNPTLFALETEARFCQLVPPAEMIVLCSFSLSVGSVCGKLDIVYPFLVLEPIIGRLSAQYWYGQGPRKAQVVSTVMARRAPLTAELISDAGAISVRELRGLRRGSVITVPAYNRGMAQLRLGSAHVACLGSLINEGGRYSAGFCDAPEGLHRKDAQAEGDAEGQGGDPLLRMSREFREGLKGLGDTLSATLSGFSEELRELKHSHEDLADRVLFGQADANEQASGAKPFSAVSGMQPEVLSMFLSNERPQLVALILSYFDDATASRTLSLLPEAMQPAVAGRIATLERVSPLVLEDLDRILAVKLRAIDTSAIQSGGLAKLVNILNLVPRATEKHVINSLDTSAPELAEALKRSMFVFEDIIILDDESISAVLENADERDILLATKLVDESERERLFKRLPADRRERLKAEFAALGRVRLKDCDEAGMRIVALIRALEEEGRIAILRADE
ncbi:MAG: FliG C-terminal domain-containing protein [Spirochaetota bacterium]